MLSVLSDGNGGFTPCPELMTEQELILFLRIPDVSDSQNYKNVVDNLVRMHELPCIHLCRKRLYPLERVRIWITKKSEKEMSEMGKNL